MLYIQFNYKIISESKQHETKSNHNEKILQKKKELKHIKEHNFLKARVYPENRLKSSIFVIIFHNVFLSE